MAGGSEVTRAARAALHAVMGETDEAHVAATALALALASLVVQSNVAGAVAGFQSMLADMTEAMRARPPWERLQ